MTSSTIADLIDLDDARAIANGIHNDPCSVLGGHKRKVGFVVVVFDPGARSMTLLSGKSTRTEMMPVAEAPGVFVGKLRRKAAYRLEGETDGHRWQFDDPYRFDPVLGDIDEYLISEGTHKRLWQALGAHVMTHQKVRGTHFAVWAPNAQRVALVGDFNLWDERRHPMRQRGSTGVWEIFMPAVSDGAVYKYRIVDSDGVTLPLKADPLGFGAEHPPETGSIVRDIDNYTWQDNDWLASRVEHQNIRSPISIYEVHLGSWRRVTEDDNRRLSYIEAAKQLVDYAIDMGFTHIELLPISEYPFDGSWGYQPVGIYAPTIRFGLPDEFRALVDAAHARGLGVLIDWVSGHFPTDAHGLARFDGTALYEHQDPKEGFHQDWNTLIYNFGRPEVANFLIANAVYWLKEYHVDGLRADAVASMLYRDYSRKSGEWVPNIYGGHENLEAISFLRRMNEEAYGECPGIITAAEESTAFPGVSLPTDKGGLGFGFKWNMGWMNDTLEYIRMDPLHRKYHHRQMTQGLHYAFTENFILPISHDEVVHGKGSMLNKMPGDDEQKFANLRAYYTFMWMHPGKKLLFMGCEFAQRAEWNHDHSLDWHLLDDDRHRGVQNLIRRLNGIYRTIPALYVKDCDSAGFEWINGAAEVESVYTFLRHGDDGDAPVLVLCNFASTEHRNWRVGLPMAGKWTLLLNSNAREFGGSGKGQRESIQTQNIAWDGRRQSAELTLPQLTTMVFTME